MEGDLENKRSYDVSAMLAYNQWKQSTSECSREGLVAKDSLDRGRRKEKDKSRKNQSRSMSRKDVKCFKCHQKVHMKRNCPK
jgi:hypothetical protein